MRPPTPLHEKHIGGPQNFQPPVQNDFCNRIGAKADAVANSFSISEARPAFSVPQRNRNARRYRGRDQRLRPLRRKVRRMREDIADQRNARNDRCLAADAVGRPVHLQQEDDSDHRANGAANRGENHMVHTERGEDVAARHDEKAGEPRAGELFSSRTERSAGSQTRNATGSTSPVARGAFNKRRF